VAPEQKSPVPVHEGFLEAFDNLLEDDRLPSSILGLLGDKPPTKIEVRGHSLGGALAAIYALWRKTQWLEDSGAPRVGNTAFCERVLDSNIH
jgi:predicted lipase